MSGTKNIDDIKNSIINDKKVCEDDIKTLENAAESGDYDAADEHLNYKIKNIFN